MPTFPAKNAASRSGCPLAWPGSGRLVPPGAPLRQARPRESSWYIRGRLARALRSGPRLPRVWFAPIARQGSQAPPGARRQNAIRRSDLFLRRTRARADFAAASGTPLGRQDHWISNPDQGSRSGNPGRDLRFDRPWRHEQSARDAADKSPPIHHWITSSARSSSDCGMVRPSALAVFRLTIRSSLLGCSIGRSAAFAPRRILSTYTAARRYIASLSR